VVRALAHGVFGVLLAMAIPATVLGADDEVGALLAKPVSPGALAMLVGHTKDPRVAQHWRTALTHNTSQVRAAAARLLYVTGTVSAVDDLRRALSAEADEDAAFEQAQALLDLGSADADSLVLEAARRLGAHRLAMVIADARGPDGLKYIKEFQTLQLSKTDTESLVSALVGGKREALDAVAGAALSSTDETLWLATVNVARAQDLKLDPTRIAAARTSSSAVIRDLASSSAGKSKPPTLPRAVGVSSADFRVIRTIGELPRGLAADVLRITGCKPGDGDRMGGAVTRYNDRRGLQQLEWLTTKASSECDSASRYLTAAGILPAPPGARAGERQLVLVPLHTTYLQCLDRSGEPAGRTARSAIRVGGDVRPPAKVKDVRPGYPAGALQSGRQGTVILESTISSAGCVSRAEVVRNVSTDFDVAALRAVTGWVFTPTLLDGAAVPVNMTVTVQFSVR